MDEPMSDLLIAEAMPALAKSLRAAREPILARWNALVRHHLPDADALTTAQVRDSIPRVLDQISLALERPGPAPTRELLDMTRTHGAVRFHESYNIKELIIEYRILRRIAFDEIERIHPGPVSVLEWTALDCAIDIALQQSVLTFIEHQKTQLKASTEAEAKFLSFLSHDLRNGLNTVMLTMQWVEGSMARFPDLAEERESLRTARDAAARTINSMERLLQAERLRKGMNVKRETVHLRDLADRALRETQRAANKPLVFENRVPADHHLVTDPGLLAIILQNLLGNAVKYSDRGTITVETRHQEDSSGDGWRLAVSDQGRGIERARVASLFDAFTRGETHGQPGVGLGLFIAAQAARLLGSQLEVASEPGRGSRFSLLLRNLPAPDAV